jgi:hypothetical protein
MGEHDVAPTMANIYLCIYTVFVIVGLALHLNLCRAALTKLMGKVTA